MSSMKLSVVVSAIVSIGLFVVSINPLLAQSNIAFDSTGGQFGNTGNGAGTNSGVNAGQVFSPNGPNPTFDSTGGQFGNTGNGTGSNSGINAGQVFGPTSGTGDQSNLSGNAGSETGLVKCGTSRDCTICDIFILIRDVFNFALGLLASLAVLSVVIGGVYILTSGGNSGAVSTGYSIISNAVIGLLLVMASFLLFSFLLVGLGFQEQNFSAVLTFQPGRIFEVKCDNASTFNDNGASGGGAATTGGGSSNTGISGIACLDATNIDDETSAVMRAISYYESQGGARKGYFTAVGGRVLPENTTNHPGGGAYGRYQIIDTTWPGWAAAAGVPKSGSSYNISPQYQDAAAATYLKGAKINTCDSFAASGKANVGSYGGACQWTPVPGCASCSDRKFCQPNGSTRNQPDFAAFCKRLLEDEKTGACKQ